MHLGLWNIRYAYVENSTGGIIALGLGVKQWSVGHCITEFVRLCDQAFSPREFDNVGGLTQVTTLRHGSKYRTQPLLHALHHVFGEEHLYGGPQKAHRAYDTKVAVTATTGTGQKPVILANYSRQEESEPDYRFEFPHELHVWEAASATSAAPSFFKPFQSHGKQVYLDGAVYYNNPVRVAHHERRFLWPDVAETPPDVLLSIGTGKNGLKVDKELQRDRVDSSLVRQAKPQSNNRLSRWREKRRTQIKRPKPFELVIKYFKVLVSTLNLCSSI